MSGFCCLHIKIIEFCFCGYLNYLGINLVLLKLFKSFVRVALKYPSLQGQFSPSDKPRPPNVPTKLPGRSTRLLLSRSLEGDYFPGLHELWVLISLQFPHSSSFPSNLLSSFVQCYLSISSLLFSPRFKWILCRCLELFLCFAPYFLIFCPANSICFSPSNTNLFILS